MKWVPCKIDREREILFWKKVFFPVDKTHTTGTPIGKYTRQTHGVTHLLHTAEVEMDIWV
jgi:hypothetical protein